MKPAPPPTSPRPRARRAGAPPDRPARTPAAASARAARAAPAAQRRPGPQPILAAASYLALAAFVLFYLAAVLLWRLPAWPALLYAGASLLCFVVYAIDKAAAKAGRRRTPERTLLLLGLCCGWPGGLLAQQWLRHKSSKTSFQFAFWISVAANLAAFAWLAQR